MFSSKSEKLSPLRIFISLLILQIVVVVLITVPLGEISGLSKWCHCEFIDFSLTEYVFNNPFGPDETGSISDMESSHTKDVLITTYYIVVSALILGMLSIAFVVLNAFVRNKKINKMFGILLLIFSIVTTLLIILAPVYFWTSFEGAIKADIAEGGFSSEKVEWYPQVAFYMFLIVVLPLQLIALIYTKRLFQIPFSIQTYRERGYRVQQPQLQPTTSPIPTPPPPTPQQQQQQNTCPTCGKPMRFVQEHQRWYCDNCKKYL